MKDTFRKPIDWNHGYAFQKHGPSVRQNIEEVFKLAGARIIVNTAVQMCQRAELENIPQDKCDHA